MDHRTARAAAGAGAADLADLVDGASAVIDGGLDVLVARDLAEADVHAVLFENNFQIQTGQGELISDINSK